jgi:hypothetical protein
VTDIAALLREAHAAEREPESFRAALRAIESSLSEADRRSLTRIRFAMDWREEDEGENLFFMSGLFKAGTTWMGLLLNANPGLFCGAKEIHAFSKQLSELYLNKPIRDLPEGEASVWDENILAAKRASLFWQIVSVADKPSAKKLGGRGPVVDVPRLIRAFPKIRIPIIIRDGRDIAVSAAFFHGRYYNQDYSRFFEDAERTRINAKYAEGWAWQFKDFYQPVIALAHQHPENIRIVRYEELLETPVPVMADLYGWLNVANHETLVRDCVASCAFEKLAAGRRRGDEDAESFFRKGVAGDWRRVFTPEAVDAFKAMAGDFLIATEYERDDSWGV